MGAVNMSVDAAGLNDLIRSLEEVGTAGPYVAAALKDGAEIVAERARAKAPVRTGKLKRAIRVGRRSTTRDRYSIEVGTFDGEAPHAHLVEGGHGGRTAAPAHPFLAPAADESESEVTEIVMKRILEGVKFG